MSDHHPDPPLIEEHASAVTLPRAVWAQLCADVAAVKELLEGTKRRVPEHPMSPAEFGRSIGKSAKTVRRWIAAGKLRAVRHGDTILITPVNAQRFLSDEPREGAAWK